MTLTPSDIRVLSALQEGRDGARAELASTLGLSQSTLWRRMKELEASGIIRKQVTLLDPDKAGCPVCVFVFIHIKDYGAKTRASFEAFVNDTPEVMECFSVTGAHDYTLIIRTPSVQAFEGLLMNRILHHPSVKTASSQIALRQHKYTTQIPLHQP